MEDTQRIVKCGNLSLHTAGGFFKKKWHSKYLVLYDGSKSGVKRLELFDSEIKFKKQQPAKIIPLVDCVRVVTCQRNKTTYTFEVRTSDQFYLLAAQSFQDMNDWVNCLRLVAFGEASKQQQQPALQQQQQQCFNSKPAPQNKRLQQAAAAPAANKQEPLPPRPVDVLLDKRAKALNQHQPHQQQQRLQLQQQQQHHQAPPFSQASIGDSSKQLDHLQQPPPQQQQQMQNPTRITTASQALNAAASALAKTRQRQPSLLGACKPQPPTDSPFIQRQQQELAEATPPPLLNSIGQIDTMTPTVRGQLIGCSGGGGGGGIALARPSAAAAAPAIRQIDTKLSEAPVQVAKRAPFASVGKRQQLLQPTRTTMMIQPSLDEEEENMLYCSIEDNPSEHNYRVKVIESELSLRCQLKCYQPTTPAAVSQQYELIGNFKPGSGAYEPRQQQQQLLATTEPVTFYQLIVGPQELTLLNDYVTIGAGMAAAAANKQQQGLWSWPYQCIRRYGFDKDNCFMFEAGRKCTSGPGQFIVQTPKAYSIYQDVVKFVNELRSASGDSNNTTGAGVAAELPTSNNSSSGSSNQVQSKQQQANSCAELRTVVGSVTQIPVTWAPSISDPTLPDSRKQFFDSLKQMGTQSPSQPPSQPQPQPQVQQAPALACDQNKQQQQPQNGHFSNSSNPTTVSSTKTSQSATISIGQAKEEYLSSPLSMASSSLIKSDTAKENDSNKNLTNKRPNQSDATPEETDESGYDQGDDSVDSSSSRSRSLATERLELGKRSSMSSSSSSTVSSNAGAPLYSVINRRAREATEQHRTLSARRWPPPQKPSETKQQRHDTRTSNTEKLLSRLIADGTRHEQDFEANLIRDVYSEITKLHATLAVTPYVE